MEMNQEMCALIAQLMRCADALEQIASNGGWKPDSQRDIRYRVAFEIDASSDVRDEINKRKLRAAGIEPQ